MSPLVAAHATASAAELYGRVRRLSGWFDWATVTPDRLPATAAQAGLEIDERWEVKDRWFACLVVS